MENKSEINYKQCQNCRHNTSRPKIVYRWYKPIPSSLNPDTFVLLSDNDIKLSGADREVSYTLTNISSDED